MAATVVPSVIVNLKVLSKDNYKEWSFRVKTYLLAEDLWKVVDVTSEPPKEGEANFNGWSKDNAKALHTIHISCGDNAYAFIEDISVAKDAWEILAKEFNPTEVSHDADVGSDIHTNQTLIDSDAGPKKDMEIEAVKDMGFDIHTNQTPIDGDGRPKKDMEIEAIEDVRSDLHTNQTSIDGDVGPKKDMEIEAVEDVRSNLHTNQTPVDGDVGPKKDMKIEAIEGGESSMNGYLTYERFFKNLETWNGIWRPWDYGWQNWDWHAVMEFIKIHPEAVRARHPSDGTTALHKAIYDGKVDIVKELVQLMTMEYLEIKDNDRLTHTALDCAVLREDTYKMVEIVKCLVEKNKKLLTIVDSEGRTALRKAFYYGRVDIVKELVQLMTMEDLEIKDKDGDTALHCAVQWVDTDKMVEIVKCLVEKNKKLLSIVDSRGRTALHKAVHSGNVKIVKELVQLMTMEDLEIKDNDRLTVLDFAVLRGDTDKMIEILKCLVEKNKKLLTIVDSNGRTPLHYAVCAEKVDIVKEWVQSMKMEDLEIKDKDGDTALACAVKRNDTRQDTDKMIEIVKCLVEKNKKLLTIVDSNGRTPLHKAALVEEADIVKELVQLMTMEDLEMKDGKGDTVLAYAVLWKDIDKMVKIVKCLVEKNKKLLTFVYSNNGIPLVSAFLIQDWKTATDIYSHPRLDTINDTDAAVLISSGVAHKFLDIPLDLIRQNPRLGITKDRFGRFPLLQLARSRSIFLSGSRLRFWEQWMYDCIHVKPRDFKKEPTTNNNDICIDVQTKESCQGNQRHLIGSDVQTKERCQGIQRHHIGSVGQFFRGLVVANLLQLPGINRIYQMKLIHSQALEILRCICEVLKTKLVEDMQDDDILVSALIFRAVELGQVEFINEICKANPRVNNITNSDGRFLFQSAVECRQEKIYNLIYGLGEEEQKDILGRKDKKGDNMLDIMTSISSSAQIDHIQGAALQMQRELQWFKEVQSLESSFVWEEIKISSSTPRQLFTKNHKDLLNAGEQSMKETATSSTVVGALIVTIMFAAAFTVPGGNGDKGFPNFLNQKAFKIFIASDAISLFFSTTSVMIFLGMLTSRYAEDDFLKSLHTKMILGLSTLFISIAAMMIAFSSGLILILPGESWIAFPAILLSTVPIASFVWMQFPLLVEIFISTYGAGPFDRKVQLWELGPTYEAGAFDKKVQPCDKDL